MWRGFAREVARRQAPCSLSRRMDHDAERKHAQKVRWMARLTWPVLLAALGLVVSAGVDGHAKVVLLAVMLGVVASLNLPSIEVVRRARREGAPPGAIAALALAVGLRLTAAVGLAVVLWG